MTRRYDLRIIKGSWGIAIGLVAECEQASGIPIEAQEVAENVWLGIDERSWKPSQFERDALGVGIAGSVDELTAGFLTDFHVVDA